MNEKRAKEILGTTINRKDGGLFSLGWYLAWTPGNERASLDGKFTAEKLEAIAWWMRHHQNKKAEP